MLQINDEFRITADEKNIILQRRLVSEKRPERWLTMGYYPTHKAALHALVNQELVRCPQEYQALISRIDGLHTLIDELNISGSL